MGTMKLTKRAVEMLPASAKDELWWDTDLRGFGVKVTAGGSKIFLIQFRMGGRGAKTRRYTIGRFGSPWDAPQARAEAARLLRLVAMGKDPQAIERSRKREEVTLSFPDYVDRFLADYGKVEWTPKTFKTRSADLRNWVVPGLRARSLTSITKSDLRGLLASLPSDKPALPRNVFAVISKLFAWAVARGDLERSPCDGIDRPKAPKSRERVLDDEELMLVAALAPLLGKPFGAFLELLLVTGQRRDDVAGMRWSELDRRARLWTIPVHRTKNGHTHCFPLSRIALLNLDQLAGGPRWPRMGLVFTTTGDTPISGFSRMKARLDQLIDSMAEHREIAPWRLHDLRRTMATNMQKLGVRFEVTEALLNHRETRSGIAGVYQLHSWETEKFEAVCKWDGKLSAMAAELQAQVQEAFSEVGGQPRIGHRNLVSEGTVRRAGARKR